MRRLQDEAGERRGARQRDAAPFLSTHIPEEEWEKTFAVNIHAMFYITKAAVPHMSEESAIIGSAGIAPHS